jgi:hypothetical protein
MIAFNHKFWKEADLFSILQERLMKVASSGPKIEVTTLLTSEKTRFVFENAEDI